MSKPNKVCPSYITQLVQSLTFKFERVGDTNVTGCWAFLPNGFQVGYGESACVDPNNFDFELGKKYAKERCIANSQNKLWELEGYLLAVTGYTSNSGSYVDRIERELAELTTKLNALNAFITSDKGIEILSQEQLFILQDQAKHMQSYADVLAIRISREKNKD